MMPTAVLGPCWVDCDHARLDGHFEIILGMYSGNGWFIDGWNRGFDHHNSWGVQLYLDAFMCFLPRWRRKYAERVREITRLHEQTRRFHFGRGGGPIAWGRVAGGGGAARRRPDDG
jgi:hypothetical protein